MSTLGNAADFGNLTTSVFAADGLASNTRAVFAGLNTVPAAPGVIDFVTISTTGNASDFGDLSDARYATGMAVGSGVRGVMGWW